MMKQFQRLARLSMLFFILAGCSREAPNAAKMMVDFNWNPPCTSVLDSPEIRLKGVPEGTRRFYISLTDLDLKMYDHGGGYVPYSGQSVIPKGTLGQSYNGPSPPHGAIHQYEIRVEALDADDRIIGVGTRTRRYPPEGEEEIRWVGPCK